MRALTLWPEWAWCVAHLGKDVENRSWSCPFELEGQRVAIHAGAYIGGRAGGPAMREAMYSVRSMARRSGWEVYTTPGSGFTWQAHRKRELDPYAEAPTLPDTLESVRQFIATRAVVAVATLARSVMDSDSPWAVKGFAHWPLRDVIALARPVAVGGKQGLWSLPPEVEAAVLEQLERRTQ